MSRMDQDRRVRARRLAAAVAALVLTAAALPAEASPWTTRQANRGSCAANKTLVRIDRKTCPATRRRPAITLTRACCQNPNRRVVCKPYTSCPVRSPS